MGPSEVLWLGDQDSNLGEVIQSHLCYRYIIPQSTVHYKRVPAFWQGDGDGGGSAGFARDFVRF